MTAHEYTRRGLLKTLGCGAAALALAGGRELVQSAERKRERPNIVFILADDLGYGDPTCYNEQSKIPTPQMDRFAQEGIRFTDAHTGSGVCTPTRYGLQTGRYCWRSSLKSGVLNGYSEPLIETDRLTIAALLKRQGYNTGCVGKWHLGLGWVAKDSAEKPKEGNVDWLKPVTHGPQSAGLRLQLHYPGVTGYGPVLLAGERPHRGAGDLAHPRQQAALGRRRRVLAGRADRAILRFLPGPAHHHDQVGGLHQTPDGGPALLSLCAAHGAAHALDADERVPGQNEGGLVRRFRRRGGLGHGADHQGGGRRRVQGQHAGGLHLGQWLALAGRPDQAV